MQSAREKGVFMFFLKFLRDKVSDPVTLSFIEHMLPRMMEEYADKSAKGGDHSKSELDEKTRSLFEAKDDQSMVSHLLNGIFPTMHLIEILESEELVSQPFSAIERRVYILSYLMHDVDKILQHNKERRGKIKVATLTRGDIEQTKGLINEELLKCGADQFLPDFVDYLEDITYLVVNTQRQWGTHLHTYGWNFRLQEDRIVELRSLCTYSDIIAYLVPAPSAVLLDDDARKLTAILAELSDDELVFSYHQLREVRGLLTSVINTGVI